MCHAEFEYGTYKLTYIIINFMSNSWKADRTKVEEGELKLEGSLCQLTIKSVNH